VEELKSLRVNDENLGYKKLIVYHKTKQLVLLIYKITNKYPKEEIYALVPQMRRCAVSILANIVEGYVKSRKEFIRFLSISIGSASELGVYLELSNELEYLDRVKFNESNNLLSEVMKLLYSFQKSLKLKV
jgi:four helix bundle protein